MSTQVANRIGGALPVAPESIEDKKSGKDDSRMQRGSGMARAFATVTPPAGADAAAPGDQALSDALKLATGWARGMSSRPADADIVKPREIAHDGGRGMALTIGQQAARELGLDATEFAPDEMVALGRQTIIDHALSDNLHPVLVGMARLEGGVAESAWASGDKEKIAEQVSAFVQSKFKNEIDLYSALAEAAAAPPTPARRELADALLRQHGIDPGAGLAGGGDDVEYGYGGLEFTPPSVVDLTSGEYYFNRDRLNAQDIRKMRMLDGAEPSAEQIARVLERLPDSLDAEFGRRFDTHKQMMSAALARVFASRLSLYARGKAIDLADATVTVSRAKTVFYRRGPNSLGEPFIRHGETAAHGYVVAMRIGDTEHRCFVSSHTGAVQALSSNGSIVAELTRQRAMIFDDTQIRAALEAGGAPWTSHIVMEAVGSGSYGANREWLTAAFGAEIEAGREAARDQTRSEGAVDTLLNLIPFRAMIVALQMGDIGMAVVAGGLDVLSLLPLVGAGFRLGAAGIKAGAPLISMGVRLGGFTGRHGVTALRRLVGRAPVLGDSIKASLAGAGAYAWGRLRPLDAHRVAVALRPTAPRLARVLDRLVMRERGTTIPNGLWRVRDAGAASARADAGGAISALPKIVARDPKGGELALLPYGNGTGAYTQVSSVAGERIGAVLVADSEGWLYPAMPVDSLERYGVRSLDAVQALDGRRAGADGTIVLDGMHYVRLGGDYVQVAPDRAVSSAERSIWRAVAPAGVLPDIIPHRLSYDADKGLWRQAEVPVLSGQSRFSLRGWAKGAAAGGVDARVSPGPAQLARFRDSLVAGMPNATSQQADVVRALLDRVGGDPRGSAILRALCAHHELLGQAPQIVLRDGAEAANQARPSLEHPVRGAIWHLDLETLRFGPTNAVVSELAAVYNNMTGLMQNEDPFGAMLAKGEPALDPKLEQAWAEWLAQDRDSGFRLAVRQGEYISVRTPREQAVDYLRKQLQEMRCHGGLDRRRFMALISGESGRHDIKINLSRRDLDSVPPLPGDINALTLSHNTIRDWNNLPQGLTVLHADGGEMTTPPPLPAGLVELDLSNNALEGASLSLPRTLKRLALARNGLTSLPVLPDTIEQLLVYQNNLQALPDDLPAGLHWIDASSNELTELPSHLPPALKTLRIGDNRLSRLPDALPVGLVELDAYANQLSALPALPETVRSIDVSVNALEELPSNLPRGIQAIEARRNRLRSLPDDLPSGLTLLDVQRNEIATLPANIDTLESCVIHLGGNPLFAWDIPAIPVDRTGPRIFFPVPTVVPAIRASDRLAQATRSWLGGHPETMSRWDAIAQGMESPTDAVAFAHFLSRLSNTVSYRDDGFRAQVVDMLVELAKPERKSLLDDVLRICVGATETCEDRVISTWNDLQTLRRNDDILQGLYDDRVDDVVDIARQMFRINVLTEIARSKERTLTVVDQVEVYLAYVVRLRDTLELTMVARDMQFYDLSGVTFKDLIEATETVRAREREEFDKFLVLDYQPWRSLLKRKDAKAYAAAEAEMHRLLDTRFEPRLQEELAKLALDPTDTAALADARKDLGPRIMREIQYDVLAPFTRALRA